MARTKNELPQTPGRLCPVEQAGLLVSPIRRLFSSPTRRLARLVSEGDTVMDLGCGPGFFTLPLARLVGDTGRVIAVDLQEGMLSKLHDRAVQAGLDSRITLHRSRPNGIGLPDPIDFALAYWVLHETADQRNFLQETHDLLRPGGQFLLVESRDEVPKVRFDTVLALAQEVGFSVVDRPWFAFSRGALLRRL